MANDTLYDEDFYLWTQAQAEGLRAAGRSGGRSNTLDWEQLAEEVEDLGKRDLRECFSRTRTIIEHLMKLRHSGTSRPKKGWRDTVKRSRLELKAVLTTSLRSKVEEALPHLTQEAFDLARDNIANHESGALARLQGSTWSLAQILGEEDDPMP